MDFYSPTPATPSLSFYEFFSFLEIISKPHTFRHFHRHRTFAMVIRGIAVKNYPNQLEEGKEKGDDRDSVDGEKGMMNALGWRREGWEWRCEAGQ